MTKAEYIFSKYAQEDSDELFTPYQLSGKVMNSSERQHELAAKSMSGMWDANGNIKPGYDARIEYAKRLEANKYKPSTMWNGNVNNGVYKFEKGK